MPDQTLISTLRGQLEDERAPPRGADRVARRSGSDESPAYDENFADSGPGGGRAGREQGAAQPVPRPARRGRPRAGRSSTRARSGCARCAASPSPTPGSRPCRPPGSASTTRDAVAVGAPPDATWSPGSSARCGPAGPAARRRGVGGRRAAARRGRPVATDERRRPPPRGRRGPPHRGGARRPGHPAGPRRRAAARRGQGRQRARPGAAVARHRGRHGRGPRRRRALAGAAGAVGPGRPLPVPRPHRRRPAARRGQRPAHRRLGARAPPDRGALDGAAAPSARRSRTPTTTDGRRVARSVRRGDVAAVAVAALPVGRLGQVLPRQIPQRGGANARSARPLRGAGT